MSTVRNHRQISEKIQISGYGIRSYIQPRKTFKTPLQLGLSSCCKIWGSYGFDDEENRRPQSDAM